MQAKLAVILIALPALLIGSRAIAAEENPEACNCELIELTEQEEAGGCPAHVKERVCPLYRQAREWKQRLQEQHDRRRREKRMEPLNIPRTH